MAAKTKEIEITDSMIEAGRERIWRAAIGWEPWELVDTTLSSLHGQQIESVQQERNPKAIRGRAARRSRRRSTRQGKPKAG